MLEGCCCLRDAKRDQRMAETTGSAWPSAQMVHLPHPPGLTVSHITGPSSYAACCISRSLGLSLPVQRTYESSRIHIPRSVPATTAWISSVSRVANARIGFSQTNIQQQAMTPGVCLVPPKTSSPTLQLNSTLHPYTAPNISSNLVC